MGLKFDVKELDIMRKPKSRRVHLVLHCADAGEAAAMYEDLLDRARTGIVRLKLTCGEIISETESSD